MVILEEKEDKNIVKEIKPKRFVPIGGFEKKLDGSFIRKYNDPRIIKEKIIPKPIISNDNGTDVVNYEFPIEKECRLWHRLKNNEEYSWMEFIKLYIDNKDYITWDEYSSKIILDFYVKMNSGIFYLAGSEKMYKLTYFKRSHNIIIETKHQRMAGRRLFGIKGIKIRE